MKKRLFAVALIFALGIGLIAVFAVVSHRKALQVETDALTPCLSPSMSYKRVVRFGAFNPFGAMSPHLIITYCEIPTNNDYDTPSITVNLFGQVDGVSKEVRMRLAAKGYLEQY